MVRTALRRLRSHRLLSRDHLARDLRTAAVALLVSALVMATPSVAARVVNADKVDGFSAVAATKPVAQRKGKLVATNRRGVLPNNIIKKAPDANKLDGLDSTALVPRVARRGMVQTGGFSAWGGGAGSYISDVVNFVSVLPAPIPHSRVTFVAAGASFTPECPGYGEVVPRGWACLYEVNEGSRFVYPPYDGTRDPTAAGIGRTGFHLYGNCTAASCWSYGGWAVRAGSAADVGSRPALRRTIP